MVDIIVGAIQPTGPPSGKPGSTGTTTVEAEILDVREPRKSIRGPQEEERRKEFRQDPASGRVLTLLVPNGTKLPKDLDRRKYKVRLRFIKK